MFIWFLSGTGLRYSEATALRRRDITIKDGRAAVRVTLAWKSKGRGEEIGPPKTPKAKRTVTCNAKLSAELAEHLPTIGLDDFVFQRPDGGYVKTPASTKKSGSRSWASSSARNLTGSLGCTRSGTPTPLICSTPTSPSTSYRRALGREDPQTTLRVYARLAKASAAAADALGRQFRLATENRKPDRCRSEPLRKPREIGVFVPGCQLAFALV